MDRDGQDGEDGLRGGTVAPASGLKRSENWRPGRDRPREPFTDSRFPIPDSRQSHPVVSDHPRHRSSDRPARAGLEAREPTPYP